MNVTQIAVEYPIMEDIVVKTEAEAKAMGYRSAIVKHVPINRTYHVQVKRVARKVQEEFMTSDDYDAELAAKCLAETGMTPSAYQTKFKRAWNE